MRLRTSKPNCLRTTSWPNFYHGSLLGGFFNHRANGFELMVLQRHKEIMEMQCDLLTSNFKGPKTVSLMKENIEHIQTAGGSLSHCAGSLKLGLKRAFEQKKKTLGAKLGCSNSGCSRYNAYVSYSDALSNSCCRYCGCWLWCVSCGYQRTGSYATCNSCGKKFI